MLGESWAYVRSISHEFFSDHGTPISQVCAGLMMIPISMVGQT